MEVTSMKQVRFIGSVLLVVITLSCGSCAREPTPEQKQLVTELKQDLRRIRQEIDQATKDDAVYGGGLIKALIGVRLEVLKTNEALVEQRIHALEAGARITVTIKATKADQTRAAELAKEIDNQKARVAEARAEADRYSGGLVQAMALASVTTAQTTLAMLEQQHFVAKYGLALPSAPSDIPAAPEPKTASASIVAASSAGTPIQQGARDFLKIETFDSTILRTNNVFTELSWKVDVSNSSDQPSRVEVTFTIYDKDDFKLDSDSENVYVPAMGTGKARGIMLISPPEKARRMAKRGASLRVW
jgi:hypothetical protein